METVDLKEKQFIEKKEEAEKNLSAENLYQGAWRGRFEGKKTQLAEFRINTGQIAHIKQLQLMTEKISLSCEEETPNQQTILSDITTRECRCESITIK